MIEEILQSKTTGLLLLFLLFDYILRELSNFHLTYRNFMRLGGIALYLWKYNRIVENKFYAKCTFTYLLAS